MKKNLSRILADFFKLMETLIFFIVFLSFSAFAAADVWEKWDSYKQENQENEGVEDYVWKEEDKKVPDYPNDDDLLEIKGPAAYQNYQYLIDAKNLIIGADGVVRYSIVIRSRSGADNVMYDGIRCTSGQIKNYAYGTTGVDGKKKFILNSNASWKPFRSEGVNGYAPILANSYFCDFNGGPLKRHEIIQNIKYGKGKTDGNYD